MLQVFIVLPLILLIISTESGATTVNYFSSGTYEGLSLAVDRDGRVTGYFREEQGVGVTKTCSFFLTGKATSSEIKLLIGVTRCWRGNFEL